MGFDVKVNKLTSGIIIFLILAFAVREGCNRSNMDGLVANLKNYEDSAEYYNLKVNGLNVEIAQNKSLVLQSNDQIKSVLESMNDTMAKLIKKFKSINSGTIINNNTYISGDTIKMKGDSIPCNFKPFKVRRDSAHYKFVGTIAKNYFTIDTLSIPNKISIISGRKKIGFLNYEDRVELFNSNPLVKTTNIGSYEVVKRKKRVGLGVSAGYGLSFGKEKVVLAPSLNLSVNYNFIEL